MGDGECLLGRGDRTARAIGDFDGDGDDDILMELNLMELNGSGAFVVENVGEANVYFGPADRDAIDLGMTGLGLALKVL